MTAQELRIGNYVLGQTKQITKVDGFFNENKAIYTDVEDERVRFIIHYLNECEGVELTEEILLKCKGVLKQDSKIFTSKYTLSLKRNKCLVITDIGTPNFMIGIAEIDFENKCKVEDLVNIWNWDYEKNIMLHQLQNLYFALTNEELNIEL